MPDVSGLLISSRLLLSASFLFCYRALTQQITLNTALPPPTTLHCAAESFYVCGLLWSIAVPVFHRNFGFLNFIVDISVILRYDSHKVQNFTEYWNDRFFAIFLLFCIMPKSAAAGLRLRLGFLFPISFTCLKVYLKTRKRWIFRKHKQDVRQRVTGILCGFQGFLRQNPTMFVEID